MQKALSLLVANIPCLLLFGVGSWLAVNGFSAGIWGWLFLAGFMCLHTIQVTEKKEK